MVHYGWKWVFGDHTKKDKNPFLLLSANRSLLLCPELTQTCKLTHTVYSIPRQNTYTASLVFWLWMTPRVCSSGCSQPSSAACLIDCVHGHSCVQNIYHRVCACVCVIAHVCRRDVRCETLTPSSPLSLWLTAERLEAGKLFETVRLNDGRYSLPSTITQYRPAITGPVISICKCTLHGTLPPAAIQTLG